MIIKQKRIQNLDNYFSDIKEGQKFQIAIPLASVSLVKMKGIGFSKNVKDIHLGDKILPAAIGPISKLNANGKWIKNKNLPKENRYMHTILWTWKEWRGKGRIEREEYRDVYKNCYQREFIPPPSEEIMFVEGSDGQFFVSNQFTWEHKNYDTIKHTINLFLELFSECQVLCEDMKLLIPAKTKKVHWKILPAGEYPWTRLKPYIEERIKVNNEKLQVVIHHRQKTILSYNPAEYAVGDGGFHDYIAYIFPEQDFVVLESMKAGNAIYVFKSNWEVFSKLTKAEILTKNFHLERIIHSKGWEKKLARLFKNNLTVEFDLK